jgi:hypothetical protein
MTLTATLSNRLHILSPEILFQVLSIPLRGSAGDSD